MPANLTRGVNTLNQRYVCLSCRLHSVLAGGRTTRYQHTGPPENDGDYKNQDLVPENTGKPKQSTSRSRIGDIIRSFMVRSDAKEKETKDYSRVESLGKKKQSKPVSDKISSIKAQSENSADVSQQKLQQKFAAQRRKDMLTMQASQASRAAEENGGVPQTRSVSTPEKKSRKKLTARAKRKHQRKIDKVALKKKAIKRSKDKEAKAMGVCLNEVAEITPPTQPQIADELSTSVEASARQGGETSGVQLKEASDNDIKGGFPGTQMTTAQKLDDIMDILESSKSQDMSGNPVKVIRKVLPSANSQDAAIVAALNELQNDGESPDVNPGKAAAMWTHYSRQLMAHLKANPEETSESLHQLRMLHTRLLGEHDSPVRKCIDSSPLITKLPSTSKEAVSGNDAKTSAKTFDNTPFVSLRQALGQDSGKAKSTDLDTIRDLPSEKDLDSLSTMPSGNDLDPRPKAPSGKVKKARAPPISPIEKVKRPKNYPKSSIEKTKSSKASPKVPNEKAKRSKTPPKSPIEKATASDVELMPLKVDQPPVPRLAYGLERVLFNPGVYQLQDPRSRVYNFDPYLQKIMPVAEFDFNALKEYITSSRDQSLLRIAKEHGKRYMGSTSSMTEVLAHFHFLLSQWRPINRSMLSKEFPAYLTSFTEFQRIPSAIFLRWKDGSYAIDADKQFATANVLSMLGKSMEKLLTLSTDDFERYRKSNPDQVTEDEQSAPESYHYSTLGDFLMRSQLDAHDPRLPGTGMFDLKTRSVVSIRMDVANYEHGIGYEIKSRQGEWESYEREYHDMIRAAFLKYSLQARMGRMDGIFVAFHNIERIFGFQYISLPEMDSTLHGQWDTSIGDQEFRLSLDLMNKVLDRATKKYPETSLRIHFETREVQTPFMYIFAEPVTEEQVAEIQSHNNAKIQAFERKILGLTRGMDSEPDDAHDDHSQWDNIQADVQEAMDKDELSIDGSSQSQEAIDEDAEPAEIATERTQVFEQGPLYARKSPPGMDDGATIASDGREDDEDVEREEDREGEEEEEDGNEDADEDGEIEENTQKGGPDFLEDEVGIKAKNSAEVERKVGGDSAEAKDIAPSEDRLVEVYNDANSLMERRREVVTAGAVLAGESVDKTTESMERNDDGSIPDEEGQQEDQIEADQGFLDSIDQEVAQADKTAESSSSKDLLAMTLTLRNKVNGEYVLRPERMTAADEWSIEYSLNEVSEPSRAKALYKACQTRRGKKMGTPLVSEDAEVISDYIQKLREMSAKGRAWRKEQDKKDRKQPVQVL